jgi:hypothetical protein
MLVDFVSWVQVPSDNAGLVLCRVKIVLG